LLLAFPALADLGRGGIDDTVYLEYRHPSSVSQFFRPDTKNNPNTK